MPAGIIVFFPSYHFLSAVKAAWLKNGKMEKLRERKEVGETHPLTDALPYCVWKFQVYFEPEDSKNVESVMTEYASAVHKFSVSIACEILFNT